MKFVLRCDWLVMALILMCGSAVADLGPLPVQNRLPLHLLFLTPRPVPAVLPAEDTLQIRASLDYSRTNMWLYNHQWRIIQDMEMAVLDLNLKYSPISRMALSLDIPIVSMNGGFLDPYVNRYHEALGISSDGTENVMAYEISKNGQTWVQGESGLVRLADITLSGQWALWRTRGETGGYSSLLASIKLPVGDPDLGYGSGRSDAGLFIPCQWRGSRWSLYVMPGIVWHGDPDIGGADVDARQSWSFFAGTAYQWNDRWQWLLQWSFFTSPLERTGIDKIDDGAHEMTIGFRYSVNRHWRYEFGFSEDIFTKAAPDFTLQFGVVWSGPIRHAGS